ncbi:hypothetical protein PGT21_015100 [Puccinia graminis f. sp. tritici]|uniref:Uncharacterized protein n=1 Tax=Puccinia graminis f. sp. tritici TaxID=56615 RepID=A0A5B0N8P7_PUCGR|nr:hypothetical protein PGT21_015100 [Puccinia graminis f. sp. tritici]KAA1136096.1 hypothetical protein PGTUg99_028678 [Puccinia graminis f. sp. tritici]
MYPNLFGLLLAPALHHLSSAGLQITYLAVTNLPIPRPSAKAARVMTRTLDENRCLDEKDIFLLCPRIKIINFENNVLKLFRLVSPRDYISSRIEMG